MKNWIITGLIATIIIILSIPLYLLRTYYFFDYNEVTPSKSISSFTGSKKCMDCHKSEYDKWTDSHHDHAMEIASNETVLGNFNNVVFESNGISTKFYKKDGKYVVSTQGVDGKTGEFEITHTFGWYPLQQYLIPFSGGRLQCLPIAWDDRDKKWYDLNPKEKTDPNDWLYWTNAGQNWNGMCAECHSTNLKKNYDINTDTYQTTWTDINVGCEACHGAGLQHVEWAEMPDMARPSVDNYNLAVKSSGIGSRKLVELCAPCHSRRAILGDYTHAEPDLLDSLLPSLLNRNMYFADGQIIEEVYVYGSFTQSKMYNRDVRCNDCHDVHSVKLLKEGNDLCLQCHRAKDYDTAQHHFHKKDGEKGEALLSKEGEILFKTGSGSECVQCHMPGRTYMGIDYRPDHSLRIPRPDLTMTISAPNACNRCHVDKTEQWSDEYITKWYGPGRRNHYGRILKEARMNNSEVKGDLMELSVDPLYPVIVRATALSLIGNYPDKENIRIFKIALLDDEALIRRTAMESLSFLDNRQKAKLISPLLYDPVKAVRIQAASQLAGEPSEYLDKGEKKQFQLVLKEYITSMEYSGDFSFGRYNLGNLYMSLNSYDEAIKNFKAAIKIDNLFYPAKVNLAMLYNQSGDMAIAEELFREVIKENPLLHEISYSLALLLAEKKDYGEAAVFMGKAASNMPESTRVHYNYGLLLQYLNKDREAEVELQKALNLEPENIDFLYALADYYFKRSKFHEAKKIVKIMVRVQPDLPVARELLKGLNERIK